MPTLELIQLGKSYGNVVAVEDVGIHVDNGELVALLGPSGCGKTTILRMIAGLERPDTGEIRIDGDAVSTPTYFQEPEKRGVGMIFQDLALWPHMSVKENISFVLKAKGIPTERVHDLLSLVNLKGLDDRMPFELSGGEQQRVAIARTLASEPSILLMDEPLSNLDAKLKERLCLEIRELQRKLDLTLIYVTHDQEEALSIADRIAVMSNGRVEQIGTPQQIYFEPANKFVADFIGSTNILEGVVISPTEIETNIGNVSCNVSGFSNRERILVSIRPEDFEFSDKGGIVGSIADRVFQGGKTTYVLNVNDTLIRVKSSSVKNLEIGTEVKLKISSSPIILMK